jgi:hypothetical protein
MDIPRERLAPFRLIGLTDRQPHPSQRPGLKAGTTAEHLRK